MAQVEQSHQQLLDDIASAAPGTGQAAFWWLGQHSFIVKAAGSIIYIDPFFAPWIQRQTPPLLDYQELTNADLALVTHDHGDHLCTESLRHMARLSPRARVIGPRTAAERMTRQAGVPEDRLHPVTAGECVTVGNVKVTAVKAKHEFFDEHPVLGFPYLGYVVEAGGVTFYHSGDTIPYEGMISTLRQWPRLDAMFLPINGRDAERYLRNCIGNLTFQEAVELAGELNTGLAVPSHYDMFVGNQEDPGKFVAYLNAKYPSVPHWLGPAGRRVLFGLGPTA